MKFSLSSLILILIYFFSLPLWASPSKKFEGSALIKIEKIQIYGNKKTQRQVILNELDFRTAKVISQKKLELGISNLKNTNLFASVDYKLTGSQNQRTLQITVVERWTTIPILKIASGGDVQQLTLGVYDPNLLGEFIELGTQYQKIGPANSAFLWFKNPRLFGSRQGLDLQVAKWSRIRTKYEQEPEEKVIKTGFLHQRGYFLGGYSYEFNPTTKGALIYEYNKDSFSDRFLSPEVLNITATQNLPIETEVHFAGLGFELGRLNTDGFLVYGNRLSSTLRYGFSKTPGLENFWQLDVDYQYLKTIFKDITLAQRILFGMTDTNALQYWYYLGGLDRIRGFADNRFAGRFFWLSNSEIRVPVIKLDWMVLQTIAFADIASTAEAFSGLGIAQGASAGGGLRFFLPKLYRFTLRLDYAVPLLKEDDMSISFGVRQFF